MQWLKTSTCNARLLHARQNVPVLRLVGPRRGQLRPRAKMAVPPIDGFGSQSPEKKAAVALRSLFTFVAARIVLEQLQGPAGPTLNGATSYNEQAYLDLMDFLGAPMKGEGGDEWLEAVMRKNHALGLRLMEVREAYLEEFDYSRMAEVAGRETREANMRLMRRAAMASLQASLGPAAGAACMSMSLDEDGGLGGQGQGQQPGAGGGGVA